MSKQPKLVLRESAVRDLSRSWEPGRFVEMGAGTGHMARIFLHRGFTGICHDLGEDNRQHIRRNLLEFGPQASVVDDIDELPDGAFDYLFAFEVLEHIEDDQSALATWAAKLRPGGRLMVTVPAHQKKYGRSDELVGHVRRYERAELIHLLRVAGITPQRAINYGYPLTELTRRVSNRLVRDDGSYDGMNAEQRSMRSAQVRPEVIDRVLSLSGSGVFRPFSVVQRWFYRFDLGDGLVATGIKEH